jgi:hypothetical protein
MRAAFIVIIAVPTRRHAAVVIIVGPASVYRAGITVVAVRAAGPGADPPVYALAGRFAGLVILGDGAAAYVTVVVAGRRRGADAHLSRRTAIVIVVMITIIVIVVITVVVVVVAGGHDGVIVIIVVIIIIATGANAEVLRAGVAVVTRGALFARALRRTCGRTLAKGSAITCLAPVDRSIAAVRAIRTARLAVALHRTRWIARLRRVHTLITAARDRLRIAEVV